MLFAANGDILAPTGGKLLLLLSTALDKPVLCLKSKNLPVAYVSSIIAQQAEE